MKKKFWVGALGVSVIAIAILAWLLIANHASTRLLADLGFAEQITIVYRDTTTTISDNNHIQDIIILIQDGIKPWPRGLDDQLGCPFDITLVFEGSDREVHVSPATDDCDAILIDDRMGKIDLRSKSKLFNIIGKYIDGV